MLIVTPFVGICNCSMFCCALLYVHSSFVIFLVGKRERELVALLCLPSWCLVIVLWLFLTMPRVCLQFVIMVFPDHTYLLFLMLLDYFCHTCDSSLLKLLEMYNIWNMCISAWVSYFVHSRGSKSCNIFCSCDGLWIVLRTSKQFTCFRMAYGDYELIYYNSMWRQSIWKNTAWIQKKNSNSMLHTIKANNLQSRKSNINVLRITFLACERIKITNIANIRPMHYL